MSIFKRKQQQDLEEKALTASSDVVGAMRTGWSAVPLLGGGARDRILEAFNKAQNANYSWVYKHSPAVRMVVDVIVRNVGQLELRLYEEISESERKPRPDHPAALSLRYPNETAPSDRFIRSLFKDFLLHDNAYALLSPGPANRIALERVPAHMIEIRSTQLFRAEIYRIWQQGAWTNGYWGGSGTYVDVAPDSIFHWHGEDPEDPRAGTSRLDTLRSVIAEDVALQQATIELANAGLQEPTWVYRPDNAPEWTPAARKGFEEDLTGRLHRRNSTPVVLEEGMEMRGFGVSPRDAQMFEVRRWALTLVAGVYGLPLGMIGLDPDVKAAQSSFYADTLPPYCEDFTRMLNLRILVGAYNWTAGAFEFNLDEKLMGDDRLRALVSATGRAVMLTNEARAKLNLKPVDGGDELVTPDNVTAGDNPKPSVDVMGPQDPNGPPQDGSYRSGDAGPPAPPAKALNPTTERLPQLHPGRAGELDRQHHNIDTMSAVVQRHFNRLSRSLGVKAQQGKAVGQTDWQRWDREFASDLNHALDPIVNAEGRLYALKLAGTFDFEHVRKYLAAMAEGAASAINDTVRGEIDQLGLDGAMARTAQHVASAGASLGAHSTQWAREEAARQSPDPQNRVKTWIADTGRHAEFDGETVALDANWPAGFAPGGAPGCRCTSAVS